MGARSPMFDFYPAAKLLRGHWFGLRGPIRLFGFLSL